MAPAPTVLVRSGSDREVPMAIVGNALLALGVAAVTVSVRRRQLALVRVDD